MSERDPSYLWSVARDLQRSGLAGGGGGGCFLGPETGAFIATPRGATGASGALRDHSLGALAFKVALRKIDRGHFWQLGHDLRIAETLQRFTAGF